LDKVEVNVPGVIDTLVVPAVDHFSEVLVPAIMIAGFAVNELILSCAGVTTVTVSVAVFDPFAFVAVSLYAVVAVGLTLTDPIAEPDEKPPGLMAMLVASVVSQASVLLVPSRIFGGLALNEWIIGFCGTVTITFAVFVTVPALFVALSV